MAASQNAVFHSPHYYVYLLIHMTQFFVRSRVAVTFQKPKEVLSADVWIYNHGSVSEY